MGCDTCDHAMHSVGVGWAWCPRCGTMKNPDGLQAAPKIVPRAKAVLRQIEDGPEDSGTHAVASLMESCVGYRSSQIERG